MKNTKGAMKNALLSALNTDIQNLLMIGHDTPRQFAYTRLLERAFKKFPTITGEELRDNACEAFKRINAECADIERMVKEKSQTTFNDPVINEAKDFINHVLWSVSDTPQCALDFGLLTKLWRYGPGTSAGTRAVHFWEKINVSEVTVYPGTQRLTKAILSATPRIGLKNLVDPYGFRQVESSEYFSVPKDDKTDRSCEKQALGPMGLQLAAHAYICLGLKNFGVLIGSISKPVSNDDGSLRRLPYYDLFGFQEARSRQTFQEELNNLMARRGSADGQLATLDFSDASNRIVCATIKMLWPSEWYEFLMTIRAPSITYPDQSTEKLNMLSGMGCGFTFAVMTLTLLALTYGVVRVHNDGKRLKVQENNIGVFGDDIVIPSSVYDVAIQTYESIGMKVNTDKSFGSGPFRESCGGDYYEGYDVTPFYVRKLDRESDFYTLWEEVALWQAKHGVLLPRFLAATMTLFLSRGYTLKVVPTWEQSYAGLKCPDVPPRQYLKLVPEPLKKRIKIGPGAPETLKDLVIGAFIGGYIETRGRGKRKHLVYTPRDSVKWNAVWEDWPNGWSSGHSGECPDITNARLATFWILNSLI